MSWLQLGLLLNPVFLHFPFSLCLTPYPLYFLFCLCISKLVISSHHCTLNWLTCSQSSSFLLLLNPSLFRVKMFSCLVISSKRFSNCYHYFQLSQTPVLLLFTGGLHLLHVSGPQSSPPTPLDTACSPPRLLSTTHLWTNPFKPVSV